MMTPDPDLITRLKEWVQDTERSHAVDRGYESQQHLEDVESAIAAITDLAAAIKTHHEAIWSEWSQTSRSIPPPADVALWAHVGIDPAARFAAERELKKN